MSRMWTRRLCAFGSITAIGLASLTAASGAYATPPTGHPDPPVATTPVVGTLPAGTRARQDGIVLRVGPDTTVRTFTLTYPVGSSSGWHVHPGIVLAVVQSGSVVRQVGCTRQTFTAGQSFTEVAPHRVSNRYRRAGQRGAEPAVLSITQLYPKDAPANRIEQDPPHCR
jgi:quercetin dioxygenase-like cupin family protein